MQIIFRPIRYFGKFLSPSVLFVGVVSCSEFKSYLEGSHFAICHDRWLFVKINNLSPSLHMFRDRSKRNQPNQSLAQFMMSLPRRMAI